MFGPGFEKSKDKVSHPTLLVLVKVSTKIAAFVWSSTFIKTGIPAAADHILASIIVLDAEKGIDVAKAVPNVVPAQVCAVVGLSVCSTKLEAFVGSATTEETLPPKSITA